MNSSPDSSPRPMTTRGRFSFQATANMKTGLTVPLKEACLQAEQSPQGTIRCLRFPPALMNSMTPASSCTVSFGRNRPRPSNKKISRFSANRDIFLFFSQLFRGLQVKRITCLSPAICPRSSMAASLRSSSKFTRASSIISGQGSPEGMARRHTASRTAR